MSYRGYRDLNVYQLSYQVAMKVFEVTKDFPKEEKCSLVDQIRRSSRSIPANLAEAWRKRAYKKMFISKVFDCCAEAGETEVWLDFAKDCGYLSKENHTQLFTDYQTINKMLNGIINNANKFCLNT